MFKNLNEIRKSENNFIEKVRLTRIFSSCTRECVFLPVLGEGEGEENGEKEEGENTFNAVKFQHDVGKKNKNIAISRTCSSAEWSAIRDVLASSLDDLRNIYANSGDTRLPEKSCVSITVVLFYCCIIIWHVNKFKSKTGSSPVFDNNILPFKSRDGMSFCVQVPYNNSYWLCNPTLPGKKYNEENF